jgi:NAD(P)-dependent dehydrogenase (short-subunit alcohol dehydrogenase family)
LRFPSANLSQKTCVITGATSGLGKAVAEKLGALQANLVLIGRNERAGRDIARTLRRRYAAITVEYIRADLSRQTDVHMLAEKITRGYPVVDVLLNNAGARFDRYHETPDGVELTFATNHLGHFLLTYLLAEKLTQAPAARVITVSSGNHVDASVEDGWYLQRTNYDRKVAYAKSKLANIMFAYELADRLKHTRVTSNVIDPGAVATHFARNNGTVSWLRHLLAHALSRNLVSARNGARPLIYLAVASDLIGVTGKYFRLTRETKSSPASYDREQAGRLWDLSVQLTGLTRRPLA